MTFCWLIFILHWFEKMLFFLFDKCLMKILQIEMFLFINIFRIKYLVGEKYCADISPFFSLINKDIKLPQNICKYKQRRCNKALNVGSCTSCKSPNPLFLCVLDSSSVCVVHVHEHCWDIHQLPVWPRSAAGLPRDAALHRSSAATRDREPETGEPQTSFCCLLQIFKLRMIVSHCLCCVFFHTFAAVKFFCVFSQDT